VAVEIAMVVGCEGGVWTEFAGQKSAGQRDTGEDADLFLLCLREKYLGGALAEDAAGALARYGRLLAVGFASGEWPKLATHDLVITNTSLVGVFAGGYSRGELDEIHARLSRLVGDGRLRNAVTAEVPFAELPEALQRMADRGVVGKLVMVP